MQMSQTDFFAGILACIAVGGIVILALAGRPVPAELAGIAGLASGYFFRGRAQVIADKKGTPE